MKAFLDLDQAGRTARLRRMAVVALARYDLAVAAVRPLSMHFNAIFRVDLEDGGRVVLRINRPGNRSLVDIRSELIWLDALRRETDLIVTEPLPTRDGDLITTVAMAMPPSVKRRREMSVASADARIFTNVFPSSSAPISLSRLAISAVTCRARQEPSLAR